MKEPFKSEDVLAKEAEHALYGEHAPWLRSHSARRLLCVFCVVSLVAYAVAGFSDAPVISLIALLVFIATYIGLRVAVRKIVDLPDRYVDERMKMLRGDIYRWTHVGVAAMISAIMILHIVLSLMAKSGIAQTLSSEQWFDLMFVLLFASLALPNILLAWREREI